MDNNHKAFFALIKAGLWEQEVRLSHFHTIDFEVVYRLSEEQSVIGVVAAGLMHVVDIKAPQDVFLQFVGTALLLEQQNAAMNSYIGTLIGDLRKADIYALLVKGQGIAQCYERPLWRACGDVDLFLNEVNYEKAKRLLMPQANFVETEVKYKQHVGMSINQWVVELHGTFRCGLSSIIDRCVDEIQKAVFKDDDVRSWMNGNTIVFLPGPDSNIIFVFIHILNHFYKGGVGLRQFCDWCRLLWTYRNEIDIALMEKRLRKMGVMSEWKSFGAFTVEYLGMPSDAMPLYDPAEKWKRKADKICEFVIEVGNFGHNRDMSYYIKYPFFLRKAISLGNRCVDLFRHARIFPMDSFRFFTNIVCHGISAALRKG